WVCVCTTSRSANSLSPQWRSKSSLSSNSAWTRSRSVSSISAGISQVFTCFWLNVDRPDEAETPDLSATPLFAKLRSPGTGPRPMARVKDNYRGLSGAEKAAIFMLSLPQQHSRALFEMMDDEEIKELSITMANLGMIDATIVERLFVEFADQLSSTGS